MVVCFEQPLCNSGCHSYVEISCNKDSYSVIQYFRIIIYMNMNWLLCHQSNVHNNHSKTHTTTTKGRQEKWNAKIRRRQAIVCTSKVPKEEITLKQSLNIISTSIITIETLLVCFCYVSNFRSMTESANTNGNRFLQ